MKDVLLSHHHVYKLIAVLALVIAGFSVLHEAQAIDSNKNYGGKITFLTASNTCVAPPSRLVKISPATEEGIENAIEGTISAFFGEQYMYMPIITKTYGDTVGPKSRGQNLLGWAGPGYVPCLVTCPAGLCPHPLGGGAPMLDIGTGT